MTRNRHMGSGRRGVIPPNWGRDHGAVMADTLDSAVTIRSLVGTTPVFDEEAGYSTVEPNTPVYSGPASIAAQQQPPGGDAVMGEEKVPVRRYEVMLPHEIAVVFPDMTITVDRCDPDPMLVGQVLVVDQAQLGTRRFARVLTCTHTFQDPDLATVVVP